LNKDQAIGGAIFLVCVVIAILYVATLFFPEWLGVLGLKASETDVRFWTIAVPVFVAFIAIMGIGAWIGWTMATTPPPKPMEEITSETEKQSEAQPEKKRIES
jgi:predicted DNA-binding transcriptional regulator